MDEFLKATGTNAFNRRLAGAARWPSWDFLADGETLHFVNHSAMGDLTELIVFNKEYIHKDGRGNPFKSLSKWKGSAWDGLLVIQRSSPLGNFTETRVIEGDTLKFELSNGTISWGRTFE